MTVNIDSLRREWWPEISTRIDRVLDSESTAGRHLADMARYHLGAGGKRIRAILPLAVASALDRRVDAFLDLGAACELLHNATLVHDDIQDGDTIRRGQATLWRAWGMPQAINVGDAMFFWSVRMLQNIQTSADVRLQLIQILVDHILQAIRGQTHEFMLKGKSQISAAEYIELVEGKTSGLFSLPLLGSMVLAEASHESIEDMAKAARQLGVLFQIQDDVIDLLGDKGRGQTGNDIREGKPSFPVVIGLARLPRTQRDELLNILETPREETTDQQVQMAISMLIESGAIEESLAEVRKYRQLALSAMKDTRLSSLLDNITQHMLQPIASLRQDY